VTSVAASVPSRGQTGNQNGRRYRRPFKIEWPGPSDAMSDVAQDLRDLAAQEDEGNDCNDRDQSEDKCVFSKALAGCHSDELLET
jgi:hypothetical protein